jgi:hypothetical protein
MTLPQIRVALSGWTQDITLIKITQTIVDHEVVIVEDLIEFEGVIQPLKPENLSVTSLGERSWEWLQIHTPINIHIFTNDKIRYNDVLYKVMSTNYYGAYNYYEYHLVRDYE